MKEVYFKIIELSKHQVLISKDFDNDENTDAEFLLVVTFFLEGIKATQSMGFVTEEVRDKAFNEVSELQLQELIDGATEILN